MNNNKIKSQSSQVLSTLALLDSLLLSLKYFKSKNS